MKNTIRETLESDLELEGDLGVVMVYLNGLWEKHRNYNLSIERDYGWDGGDTVNFVLIGVREETDEEYNSRISEEAEKLRKKEERRLKRIANSNKNVDDKIKKLEAEIEKLKQIK